MSISAWSSKDIVTCMASVWPDDPLVWEVTSGWGVAENNSESGSQRISYSGMEFIVGKCRGMAVALYGRA